MLHRCRIYTGTIVATIVVTLAAVSPAQAQRRNMGGLRPGHVSPARLLTVEAVQAELKLTDQQKEKATEINEALSAGRHELFAKVAKDSKERGAKTKELEKKAQGSIDELLDDSQNKRLRELLLQVNGASELTNKEMREALQITKEQQKKLATVRHANAKARKEALADFDGDRMAKSVELQREGDAKLLEVLTPAQRKQFEAMQGKKIALKLFET
jgi:hypothetical protein